MSFKLNAINSLRAESESCRLKALTSLELLLDKPVGIGDHSTTDYHNNLKQALQQLIDADDAIETLDKYFPTSEISAKE